MTTVERVLHLVHESRHVGSMFFVWSLVLDAFVYDWLEAERLSNEMRGKMIVQSWMRMRVRKNGVEAGS